METAVLDACVLFRGGVRDFLLWVAEAGAFSPAWSNHIHGEWISSRRTKLGDPWERLEYARMQMESAFPGAKFKADPAVMKGISLDDQDDVHVVATAIAAQAQTIVTYNLSDFPASALEPFGVRAEPPDVFCVRMFGQAPVEFMAGARQHRTSLKNPAFDPISYLDHLEMLELNQTAHLLRKLANAI